MPARGRHRSERPASYKYLIYTEHSMADHIRPTVAKVWCSAVAVPELGTPASRSTQPTQSARRISPRKRKVRPPHRSTPPAPTSTTGPETTGGQTRYRDGGSSTTSSATGLQNRFYFRWLRPLEHWSFPQTITFPSEVPIAPRGIWRSGGRGQAFGDVGTRAQSRDHLEPDGAALNHLGRHSTDRAVRSSAGSLGTVPPRAAFAPLPFPLRTLVRIADRPPQVPAFPRAPGLHRARLALSPTSRYRSVA